MGYKGLQGVTRGYNGLQDVTGCYRGLRRVKKTVISFYKRF